MSVEFQSSQFLERRGDWFDVEDLQTYEFAPSKSASDVSDLIYYLDALKIRTAYTFTPHTKKKVPLVILFHGAGRDGLSVLDMWLELAQTENIALLAPNSNGQTWPTKDLNPALIHGLISSLENNVSIDFDLVFLFGHSDGASYAQKLLRQTKGPWRAASLHAGYTIDNTPLIADRPKPFRVYIGDREHIFPLDVARSNGKRLAGLGHLNDLIVISRHTHWLYEIGPQIAEDSWKWLQVAAKDS